MFKFVRRCSLFAAFLCLMAGAHAQSTSTQTPFERQMSHVDLALGVPYETTASSAGRNVSQTVSSAAGFIGTIRYTHSPYIGAEMIYKRSRETQTFSYLAYTSPTTPPTGAQLGVEDSVEEIAWGYVAHPDYTFAGIKPFGGVGLGSVEFKPTKNGGEGLARQFRADYYWNAGADYAILGSRWGVRLQVRQIFFIAPDFQQNYLVSGSRTSSLEPSFAFTVRF
jgi:hypothetical protein